MKVQHKDADEWSTVTGARARLADPKDVDAGDDVVVVLLKRPSGWVGPEYAAHRDDPSPG